MPSAVPGRFRGRRQTGSRASMLNATPGRHAARTQRPSRPWSLPTPGVEDGTVHRRRSPARPGADRNTVAAGRPAASGATTVASRSAKSGSCTWWCSPSAFSRSCCSVSWPRSPLRSISMRQNRSHGYSTTNIDCAPAVTACPRRRRAEHTRRHAQEVASYRNRSSGLRYRCRTRRRRAHAEGDRQALGRSSTAPGVTSATHQPGELGFSCPQPVDKDPP